MMSAKPVQVCSSRSENSPVGLVSGEDSLWGVSHASGNVDEDSSDIRKSYDVFIPHPQLQQVASRGH